MKGPPLPDIPSTLADDPAPDRRARLWQGMRCRRVFGLAAAMFVVSTTHLPAQTILEGLLQRLNGIQVAGLLANVAQTVGAPGSGAAIDGSIRDIVRAGSAPVSDIYAMGTGAPVEGSARGMALRAAASAAIGSVNTGEAVLGLSVGFATTPPDPAVLVPSLVSLGDGLSIGAAGAAGSRALSATQWVGVSSADHAGVALAAVVAVNASANGMAINGEVARVVEGVSVIAGTAAAQAIGAVNAGLVRVVGN